MAAALIKARIKAVLAANGAAWRPAAYTPMAVGKSSNGINPYSTQTARPPGPSASSRGNTCAAGRSSTSG